MTPYVSCVLYMKSKLPVLPGSQHCFMASRNTYFAFVCCQLILTFNLCLTEQYHMTFKFVRTESKIVRKILTAHGYKEVSCTQWFFILVSGTNQLHLPNVLPWVAEPKKGTNEQDPKVLFGKII